MPHTPVQPFTSKHDRPCSLLFRTTSPKGNEVNIFNTIQNIGRTTQVKGWAAYASPAPRARPPPTLAWCLLSVISHHCINLNNSSDFINFNNISNMLRYVYEITPPVTSKHHTITGMWLAGANGVQKKRRTREAEETVLYLAVQRVW